MKKKKAFTLAEVLITLTIIGVIAAITIPNLYSKYQKHVWVTQLHKCYNRIVTGNTMIVREIEDSYPATGQTAAQYNQRIAIMTEAFSTGSGGVYCGRLAFTDKKACKYATYAKTKNVVKNLNGTLSGIEYVTRENEFLQHHNIFTYPDGSVIGLFINISNGYFWSIDSYRYSFTVDVNGPKGPNQIGRDIFIFRAKKNTNSTIVPFNINDTSDCNTAGQGTSCAAKIIADGWKMNY